MLGYRPCLVGFACAVSTVCVLPQAAAATATFEGLALGALTTPVDVGGIQVTANGPTSVVDATGVAGMSGQALSGVDGTEVSFISFGFAGAPSVSFDLSVLVPGSRSFLAVATAVGARPTDFTIGQDALSVPLSDAPVFATKRFTFDSALFPIGMIQLGLSASPADGAGDVRWTIDNVSAVPEPGTAWLYSSALALIGAFAWRRRWRV
jgi:PEP-CTERM motif